MPWLPPGLAIVASKQSTRQARGLDRPDGSDRRWHTGVRPSTPLQMDTVKAASVPDTPPVPARNVPLFVPLNPVEGLPRTTICTNFVRCCPRLARYRVTKGPLGSRTAWDKETTRTGPFL